MASLERTAYPRLGNRLSAGELQYHYNPTELERDFIHRNANGNSGRLTLTVMLKTRQRLGYFPALVDVPQAIRLHHAKALDLPETTSLIEADKLKKTRSRYRLVIRAYLDCRLYADAGPELVTLFLLRYISEADFRQSIRAETTKIESFHSFMGWIGFGGPVIKSGDPVEHAKQMKYIDLVANAIMLHNVVDLTDVLAGMLVDGYTVTKENIARLSPYMREHIRRFGQYVLDMDEIPPSLEPKPLPIAA